MTQADAKLRYRWRAGSALGLLAFINLLNYLDRNIIFALFESIKRELSLNDVQLGVLFQMTQCRA